MSLKSTPNGRLAAIAVATMALTVAAHAQRGQSSVPASPDDKVIVHVLNRIGFGPAPGDIDRVRRMGLAAYIDQQLAPSTIADAAMEKRLAGFITLKMTSRELADTYFLPAQAERQQMQRATNAAAANPEMSGAAPQERAPRTAGQPRALDGERRVIAELGQQKVLRAAYSERQLEEVMVDFWFNHFNVFVGKGQTRLYLTEYERDTIRPRVWGKFRDLLGAVAESPAMLFYLDNWRSAAPAGSEMSSATMPRRRRGAQQQQPPAQNRTRGINENYARELMELHTMGVDSGYTQKDVTEVARAFTGWTLELPRQGGASKFEPRMHDNGEKVVLGVRIPSGGGKRDGELVLDILAKHPATARFIATKLARRFVADDPPKALVDRAAARFLETGGEIREVVRTIITSPEFFAPAAYRAKVKTPLEFVASAVRASGVDLRNGMPLVQALRELGMPLYGAQPPTGYADRAEAWVNTGALLSRMNFAVSLAGGRLRGSAAPPAVTQQQIEREVLAGDVSETTRVTVARAANESQRIALLLGSPDFQRR